METVNSAIIADDKKSKIIAIITGAFLMGALWRMRGDHAFGSSWGMFTVALIFSLFVFAVFPKRQKSDWQYLGLTVLLTGITAAGWGTINDQVCGLIENTPINPLSGVAMMLLLGFGWMPFFAFLTGRFFSKRSYSMKDIIFAVIVFYAIAYLCKASLSHAVLNLVNPQASKVFAGGLAEQGIKDSPYLAYMKNFDNISFGKDFIGGRNYFSCVEAVSNAIASLAVVVYQRFILKDKHGSLMSLLVNTSMAVSITVADYFMFLSCGGYHYTQYSVENSSIYRFAVEHGIASWSMWEYMTGFLLGLFLMIVFFSQKKTFLNESDAIKDSIFKYEKASDTFSFITVATFCVTVLITRPIFLNFSSDDKNAMETFNGKDLIVPMIIFGLILEAIMIVLFITMRKKRKDGKLSENIFIKCCTYGSLIMSIILVIIDKFIGTKVRLYDFGSTPAIWTEWLVLISLAVVIIGMTILIVSGKKLKIKGE